MTHFHNLLGMLPFSPEGAEVIVQALPRRNLIERIKLSPNISREQAQAALDTLDKLQTIANLREVFNAAQDELEAPPVIAEVPRMVMTTKDAAEVLDVSQGRVRQWVGEGMLRSISGTPNRHLFDAGEVQDLAFSRHKKTA